MSSSAATDLPAYSPAWQSDKSSTPLYPKEKRPILPTAPSESGSDFPLASPEPHPSQYYPAPTAASPAYILPVQEVIPGQQPTLVAPPIQFQPQLEPEEFTPQGQRLLVKSYSALDHDPATYCALHGHDPTVRRGVKFAKCVLTFAFFPISLIFLALDQRRCNRCHAPIGPRGACSKLPPAESKYIVIEQAPQPVTYEQPVIVGEKRGKKGKKGGRR